MSCEAGAYFLNQHVRERPGNPFCLIFLFRALILATCYSFMMI